jgi:MFS family permease
MQHSFEAFDRQGGFARIGLLRPLRLRDFRLLWIGMTVSLVGDGVFLVATAWTAYSLWNAPEALSIVGIAMTVPTIACLLAGGVASDRFDRRLVMIWSDSARGLTIAVLAALAYLHHLTFPTLCAAVAVYSLGTGFFTPAFEATVPALVPVDLLPQANSLDQFIRPVAMRLVGPAAGGFVIGALGAGSAFTLDAASFAVSAVAVAAMRPPRGNSPETISTMTAIRTGVAFVRGNAWLWATLAAAAVAYLLFLGPTEVLLPYLVKNDLHRSAADLGIVLAAGGAGALGAAAWMGQRREPRRPLTFTYVCWAVATLAVAGYGLARSVPALMLACFVFNALEAAGTVVWATIKQRHVPSHLLGRISSLDWLISISLLPVSYAVTAPVSAAIGARGTLELAGIAGAAVTLAALYVPRVREIDEPQAGGARDGSLLPAGPREAKIGTFGP